MAQLLFITICFTFVLLLSSKHIDYIRCKQSSASSERHLIFFDTHYVKSFAKVYTKFYLQVLSPVTINLSGIKFFTVSTKILILKPILKSTALVLLKK